MGSQPATAHQTVSRAASVVGSPAGNGRLRILYVGALWDGSTSGHRKQALCELGHDVVGIETETPYVREAEHRLLHRVRYRLFKVRAIPGVLGVPDEARANAQILERVRLDQYDVLWLNKGLTIHRSTMEAVKAHAAQLPNRRLL